MIFSGITKVLSNGFKITVTRRANNTVTQLFTSEGSLMRTKVKKCIQETLGNKKVFTKEEFIFSGEPHYVTGAGRISTSRVCDENGELLGILETRRIHEGEQVRLQDIVDNLRAHKTGFKRFITPEGNIYKEVYFKDGIKQYIKYLPDKIENSYAVRGGYMVSCDKNGIMFKEGAGLDLSF